MTTGTVLVQNALKMIGAHSVVSPANVEAINDGGVTLVSMLEMWLTEGVNIGFTPPAAVGNDINEPPDTTNGITTNLAVLLLPNFPGVTPTAGLFTLAATQKAKIFSNYRSLSIPKKRASSTLPLGSGNDDCNEGSSTCPPSSSSSKSLFIRFPEGDTNDPTLTTAAARASKLFTFGPSGELAVSDARIHLSFASRAEFVTWVAGLGVVPDGSIIKAGKLIYEGKSGQFSISDLPGFIPFGHVYSDHFLENVTPGTTDTTKGFVEAVAYQNSLGGGDVRVLRGVHIVTDQSVNPSTWDDRVCIHILVNNIRIVGDVGAVLKLGDSENAHIVKLGARADSDMGLVSVSDCGVFEIEIDGNRANQTLPTASDFHNAGVSVSDGCLRAVLDELYIHDTIYYGIGFQREAHKNCLVRNTRIEDTGADGIDCKNDDGTGYGNRIEGLYVKRFGLALDGLATPQAGIDLRSGWSLGEHSVTDWQAPLNGTPASQLGLVGVRVLKDADSNFNALDHTTVSNGYVEPSAETVGTSPIQKMQGLRIDALSIAVSKMSLNKCGEAARISQRECGLEACYATNGIDGFILDEGVNGTNGDQITMSACVARGNSGTGFEVGANLFNVSLIGCTSRGNDIGLDVESGATDTRIIGGSVFSNTTTDILDNGTNTVITSNEGGIEQNYVLRGTLVTDIAGAKSAQDGFVTTAQAISYVKSTGATAITDMPDWLPFGTPVPQHFGAVADGTDQATELQLWMDYAFSGNPAAINQPGIYGLLSELSSPLIAEVDIVVANGVEINALSGFAADSDMIHVPTTGSTGTDHTFSWVGGSYDCQQQPNSGGGQDNDLFSLNATNHSSAKIHLDRTYAGADYRTAGGDSHIFAAGSNLDLSISSCTGAVDLGIYASAESTAGAGSVCRIRGNFYFCNSAVEVKRTFELPDIRITTEDCKFGGGYTTATVGGNTVKSASGGILEVNSLRTERSAFIQAGDNVSVVVNALEMGLALTGGTPYASASGQALYVSGSSGVKATVNAQGMNSAIAATSAFVGTLLDSRAITAGTLEALDNMVSVQARDIGRPVEEQNSSDRNFFTVNEENNVAAPILVGGDSYIKRLDSGRISEGIGAVPGNFTSGSQRATSTGTAQFREEIQSDDGWQLYMKDAAGTIEGRIRFDLANNLWQFRPNSSNVRFEVTEEGAKVTSFAVASLPAGADAGTINYATDGRKNGEGAGSGTGVIVFYDGSNWIAVDSGATVVA